MGAYAECWLESLHIGSTKYDFDFRLMQLFRSSDKRVQRIAVRNLPNPLSSWIDTEDPQRVVEFVYYSAPAATIKDRLELLGYTLSTAKKAFLRNIRAQAKEYSEPTQGMEEYYENRARLLKSVDVDKWLAALDQIRKGGKGTPTRHSPHKSAVNLEEFMLEGEHWYGYSGADLYIPLRLTLETCRGAETLSYNLTDLVAQGYLDKDEDCVVISSELAAGEYAASSKVVVLTEGRTDGWIISEAMKLLYPHIHDYFSFMDFESARVEGGASQLARLVKSFAGAGIANKVVAIFDNDTIGHEAIRLLRQINLPGNIAVLKLPNFTGLRKYPTIGPSGRRAMNINGAAASIELYLGEDVLRENGKLFPVHWGGYVHSMSKYQGALSDTDKDKVHKLFKDKLAKARDEIGLTQNENWAGLCVIMSEIFSAFHNFDRRIILESRLDRYSAY
jgi:hypothetical protein